MLRGQESPAQSPSEERAASGAGAAEPDSDPAPAIQQIEAISSGTEREHLPTHYEY